jgi:glutamine amidotransferase
MIVIVDYDIGNISAVQNMFQRIGVACTVSSMAEDIEQAERIVLPGNGAFDACMLNLKNSGLIPVLESRVLSHGVPLLGICVGAQMLGHGSAEGVEPGLGWLNMRVERFPAFPNLRVPHMGWNHVKSQKQHTLTDAMSDETRFYFVHSYYMKPIEKDDVLLATQYGIEFASAVARGNIMGVQFHPEKSHRFGKQLFKSFAGGH